MKPTRPTITYEPFTAGFTGQLTTFLTVHGRRCSFAKPYPKIEKGTPYVVQLNLEAGQVRLIRVVLPPAGWR